MTAQPALLPISPSWPRWALRISLTLAALLLLSQSITAGLFLADVVGAFPLHRELATVAGIALMVAFVAAILCARLCGDARWPIWATVVMLALMSLQAFAGYRSLTALHVPLGVLTIAGALALAAWSWIPRPVAAQEPAPVSARRGVRVGGSGSSSGLEPVGDDFEEVSSMNRAELVEQLDDLRVSRAAYCLDGGLPNECYTLEPRAAEWAVYYSERGRRSMEHVFSTEAQACQFLFDWIAQSPASRMTPSQIAATNDRARTRQARGQSER
jgi:hypothetical protein